jgi:hypothetical protein
VYSSIWTPLSGASAVRGRGGRANVAVDSASTSGEPSLTQYRAGAG